MRKEIGADLIKKSLRSKTKISESRREMYAADGKKECTNIQTAQISCKKVIHFEIHFEMQNYLSKVDGHEAGVSAKRFNQNKVSTVKVEEGRDFIETEVNE